MSINSSSFSAGYTGCKVISSTSANLGRWRGFVVNEDAVISVIRDKSDGNIISSLGLSGVTLKSGAFISIADGDYISSITLDSGSIIAYNE